MGQTIPPVSLAAQHLVLPCRKSLNQDTLLLHCVPTSQCLCSGEQATVDCVNNWLCRDLPTTKVTSVQPFDRVFTARHAFKLEVDITLRVGIE